MNKVELASAIGAKTGNTKKLMVEVLDSIIETITEVVASGEDVKLSGLGTFTTVERAAREGRNPATGEALHIEASVAPKFKAASALKDAVKNA